MLSGSRESVETAITPFATRLQEFLSAEILPNAERWEQDGELPKSIFSAFGRYELFQECAPSSPHALLNKQELARQLGESTFMGIAASVVNHLNIPLLLLNDLAQEPLRTTLLEGCLSGNLVGAVGITESGSGTDVLASTQCTVAIDGGHLTLSGSKLHVLNAPIADFCIILARSREAGDALSFSLVAVPLDQPGINVVRMRAVGTKSGQMGRIDMDRVVVPRTHLLGRPHRALAYLPGPLSHERLIGSAAVLAVAWSALKATYEHASNRPMLGGTLAGLQAFRHDFADLTADYEIAKVYLDQTIKTVSITQKYDHAAAAAVKLLSATAARRIIDRCFQYFGGRAYLLDSWIGRLYRDSLAMSTFAGSDSAMKEIIVSAMRRGAGGRI